MRVIKLCFIFLIIELVAADIHLEGGKFFLMSLDITFVWPFSYCVNFSTYSFNCFSMLDCDLSEVFVSSADYPDWSSCLSFKNQSDECGKEELKDNREYPRLYSPVNAYERILTKNHWVRE